jgi:hypothetical protein
LTTGAISDLTWWRDTFPLASGLRLLDDTLRPTLPLWTDASQDALGGFFYQGTPADLYWENAVIPQTQAYALPRTEALHINVAEINAVLVACKLWAPIFAHSFVIIHTDNTTAQTAFAAGTTRGIDSMHLIRDLVILLASLDTKVHTCRVSSKDNGLADALSRLDWHTVANICPQWPSPSATFIRQLGTSPLLPQDSGSTNALHASFGPVSNHPPGKATM